MKRLIAYTSLVLAACAISGAIDAAAQTIEFDDPIELFAKLMPVVTHPRCMGCHGAVNPFSGTTHGGGVIGVSFNWQTTDMNDSTDNKPCLECHTAEVTESVVVPGPNPVVVKTGMWRLAPKRLAFVGKDTRQICQQFAQFARLRSHLELDKLIGLAFIGQRGDATEQSDRPPMTRAQFVEAANVWLDEGDGSCGGWEGQITQKETFVSKYGFPMNGADGTVAVNESASRDIVINRGGGGSRGTFSIGGNRTMVQTAHLIGEHGPCTSIVTSDSRWVSLTTTAVKVPVHVKVEKDGSYTIRFVGPEEKTSTNSTTHIANNCGIQLPLGGQDPPVELDWPQWKFTIRCPSAYALCQLAGSNNQHLVGALKRTILNAEDAAAPYSWLADSPAGIARSDNGKSLPIDVTVTWDLKLTQ